MKAKFLVPSVVAFLVPHLLCAQEVPPAEKLAAAYKQARADAIKQVNLRYVQQADAVMKLAMQANDLEKATATSAWSKRLLDDDDENDTDGIAPNPTSPDRLVALQTRYLKERSEAILRVNRFYAGQVESTERTIMQRGDLDGAKALAELLAKIKAELGAPVAAGAPAIGGDPLFAADKQKKWKRQKGEWTWDGTKLGGHGDGSIQYDVTLQPPFVAQFKFNPKAGTRAGVIFDGVGLQNAAYADSFGLTGVDGEKYFPYTHGTVYRCAVVVAKKQTELFVDGKLVCTGPGREKKVDKITIYSGDGWSPGTVEVQDFILLRGTEKVPVP